MAGQVPALRIKRANDHPIDRDGEYVLYWMIANRRGHWNFALQRAVEKAKELARPLVVLEGLRSGYRWASDRLHGFILDGMADNARRFAGTGVLYYPYIETHAGAGKGLLRALSRKACLVVSDDFPDFFLPDMVAAAARQLTVRLELVDANGLLPLAAAERDFTTAHSFRRFLQKNLLPHLERPPAPDPLQGVVLPVIKSLPEDLSRKWPEVSSLVLNGTTDVLRNLPIDHGIRRTSARGGPEEGQRVLLRFIQDKLDNYAELHNHPDEDAASGLSPYLHFGHLSVHQVFHEIMLTEGWTPDYLGRQTSGSRSGWWGVRPTVEAFLDELVTWRELGYNMCRQRQDYAEYESLPPWALQTLDEHAADPRPYLYSFEELETARTHDDIWNAAQRELLREGRIHNYLRMLWGKKILEWSGSPRQALAVMIELNNKYALDGRDPNSYSGIFWILGRFDRAWGPERPIFGKVRYMSSENTARKVRLKRYLERYGG